MKVCIDAEHGDNYPGAVGKEPYIYKEKDFNLSLALLLEEELEWRGHWVVMTRRQDRSVGLHTRAKFANRLGTDLFVSIPANAAGIPSVEGMEVWYYPGSTKGQEAAVSILKEMKATFPDHRDRGIKEGNLVVLRETKMPSVLMECEFITDPTQLPFMDDLEYQLGLAEAISEGMDTLPW